MKLRITISMAMGLTLVLTSGPMTQNAYAASRALGGSLGHGKGLGGITTEAGSGSSVGGHGNGLGGITTEAGSGSSVGGVDPHVFCIAGVMTPICK